MKSYRQLAAGALSLVVAAVITLVAWPVILGHQAPAAGGGQTSTITIAANIPNHGWTGLQGSDRVLNVSLANCATCLVNWTVPSGATLIYPSGSSGALTSTTSLSNYLGAVHIHITAAPGHCTITGSGSSAAWTSTSTVNLTAASAENPSVSVTIPIAICANTTQVRLAGKLYQQVYEGQVANVTADVQGNSDQTGTWTLTSSPASAAYTLTDTATRRVGLSATTPGRYGLTFTSHADSTQTASAVVYVAPVALPYAATSNSARPVPCYQDPAFTGPTYTVGTGKQYANLQLLPNTTTLAGGALVQIFNTDTTGASPSVYHNYWQFASSGTASNPIYFCGVPDSTGHLPIIDGTDATGQANVANYGGNQVCYTAAIFCTWAGINGGHPTGQYGPSNGPSHLTLAALHIRHARGSVYAPGATTGTETAMIINSSCVAGISGSDLNFTGLELEDCPNGIYTAENYSNGFADYTQQVSIQGVHVWTFGNNGRATEHALYYQSFWADLEDFILDQAVSGDQGSGLKWRGIDLAASYGYIDIRNGTRPYDGVGVQDASPHVDTGYYVDVGAYANGDGTPDIIAGLEECLYNGDWLTGLKILAGTSASIFHQMDDHDSLLAMRQGALYVADTTVVGGLTLFDVSNAQNPSSHLLDPLIYWQNVLAWGIPITNNYSYLWGSGTTNLYQSSTATPWVPTPNLGAVAISGWYVNAGSGGTNQFIAYAPNNLITNNHYSSGALLTGLSGSVGACLNGTIIQVQYGGGANFQGPTTCGAIGSDGSRISDSGTFTPQVLGGDINGGTADGWGGGLSLSGSRNICYGTCPYQNSVPLQTHIAGLVPANYLNTPTQPFTTGTLVPNSTGTSFAGTALPASMAVFPVRRQWSTVAGASVARSSQTVIGGDDGGYTPPPPPPPTPTGVCTCTGTVTLTGKIKR